MYPPLVTTGIIAPKPPNEFGFMPESASER
jgi:hypothetical protein